MKPGKKNHDGFTLIEVIVTLVIIAIMGTMFFEYSQQTRFSATPLTNATAALNLQKVMGNIYVDHKLNYPSNLIGIQSNVGNEGTTQNNSYGQYTVVSNHFIKFVSNTESAIISGDPQTILKVTISSNSGGQLSILLTNK